MSQAALSVPSRSRFNVYAAVTNKIIGAIERGAGAYRCPWHASGPLLTLPTNAATLAEYRGVNVLALWVDALSKGYPTGMWASYKQWQNVGAQVRSDEHGALIVFYKRAELTPNEPDDHDTHSDLRFYARASWVFNASQVDGFTPPQSETRTEVERIQEAEAFVEAIAPNVQHGFQMACYRRKADTIEMPDREAFVGTETSSPTESYYATLLHELTHWSGAPHRLNREGGKRFGDDAYAMEELVAELGAAFMCAAFGIASEPRTDHAAYIATWLKVLKQDNRAIFTAASKAQEAFEHLAYLATKNESNDKSAA
jgi:antirestriction protein ArdC